VVEDNYIILIPINFNGKGIKSAFNIDIQYRYLASMPGIQAGHPEWASIYDIHFD
jgi:hypothetical protein